MDFSEKLTSLAQRAPSLIDSLQTEEATKNALIMPFIAALGYDVFDPTEVIPEFTADIGTKKGEKVDYAIRLNDEIIMIFECKKAGVDLNTTNVNQLFRYFTTTHARIGILTNGTEYRFYSDLEALNKMDTRPFLVLDLLDLNENQATEIKKLSKDKFDLENMLSSATELKFTREIRKVLQRQFEEPETEFVRFFFNELNKGARFTPGAKEQFTEFVEKALHQYVNDSVNRRLRSALQQEDVSLDNEEHDTVATSSEAETTEESEEDLIVTTPEEIEGFHVVRAIVREVVTANRITHRDTKSYMGILLDNNNRKPICRLRFNWSQKYLGIMDADKNEQKVLLEGIDDIYNYADQLKSTALGYDQ